MSKWNPGMWVVPVPHKWWPHGISGTWFIFLTLFLKLCCMGLHWPMLWPDTRMPPTQDHAMTRHNVVKNNYQLRMKIKTCGHHHVLFYCYPNLTLRPCEVIVMSESESVSNWRWLTASDRLSIWYISPCTTALAACPCGLIPLPGSAKAKHNYSGKLEWV